MRYRTGVSAQRSKPALVTVTVPPNGDYLGEVHADLGGLSVWLSEAEATALGRDLIEAASRIRAEQTIREGNR